MVMEQQKIDWKEFEVIDSRNVSWSSTDEYEIEYENKTYTIRVYEDDNGVELLYLGFDGWETLWGDDDDQIKNALYDLWSEGNLSK
jgi:hypothetical protein